jgi:hypothetical protein
VNSSFTSSPKRHIKTHDTLPASGEQFRAGLGELHIDAGFVPPQPALGDREGEARAYSAGPPPCVNRNGPLLFSM